MTVDAVIEKLQSRYGNAQSYRADGVVVEYETDKNNRVGVAQSFSLLFDRKKGIKLVVHAYDRSGRTQDTTAWGSLSDIEVYVEHRYGGFIELTETPNKNARYASRFNQLVSYTFTNPGDTLGALLIDGNLPPLARESGLELKQEKGKTIVQQGTQYWRQYVVDPADGKLTEIKAGMRGYTGQWATEIRLLHQKFDVAISQAELSYTLPAYARLFDPRNRLDADERRKVLAELANGGNEDEQIKRLRDAPLQADQKPSSDTFVQLTQQLQDAQRLHYPGAYRREADFYQPSNRNWFPADLAALSDDALYSRQRAILWNGLSQCDLDSAAALNAAHPPLSDEEKTRYRSQWDACEEKMIPNEVRKAQMSLDDILR